jgi:hypothetical protein
MSDKLNKFGFFAGKLFAKTVNEVKPLLANDAPPQPDLPTTLSPEEKIRKVIEILYSKNVSKNIDNLLNRYVFESNEIICKQGGHFNSASPEKVDGISDDLINDLDIKEINTHLIFYYKDKSLKILLTNNKPSGLPDGDYFPPDSYDLIIIYNDVCVLKDSVIREFDTYGSNYRVGSFSSNSLKTFKNGSWMDDLDFLIKNLDEFEKNRNLKEEKIKKQQLADKLDLDPHD